MHPSIAAAMRRLRLVIDGSEIIAALTPNSSALPDAVALLAQADRELDFHIPRAIVRHRVVRGVELGHEAQSVEHDEAIGLNAGLVLVEAHIRVDAGHADVDARL